MKVKFITKKLFSIMDENEKGLNTGGALSESGTILFGCDDRLTPEIIRTLGLPPVRAIFCSDYRRSVNGGVLHFDDAEKFIHENFYELFTRPELWWEDPENRWHIYKYRPDDDILSRGACHVSKLTGNEKITVGSVDIMVLLTPGDTDFSMSFIVQDNGVTVGFCGGLLYKGGKVPYLYRLVQGIEGQGVQDYHGFLRGIARWKDSLARISGCDVLVPCLGGILDDPKHDINTFNQNIDLYYESYAAVSSMNHFFEGSLKGGKRMESSHYKDLPSYVKMIGGQSAILCSRSGKAFVIDCGSSQVTQTLVEMLKSKDISSVDAMYITHYHDDHVDGCEYFRKHFDCPIYADESLADVVKRPEHYRLPCISPVRVDATALKNGHSWHWQEFELTSFSFPGQTLYHGGLVAKVGKDVILFAGDSFSATGIDDYCPFNRNFTGLNRGYRQCIKLIARHSPNYIIGQHQPLAFTLSDKQLDYMENNLQEREKLILQLIPWSSCDYALDDQFVMAYPYEQDENELVQIRITGHGAAIDYEIIPPKPVPGKNVYGIRVYIDGAYAGQKNSYIVNRHKQIDTSIGRDCFTQLAK